MYKVTVSSPCSCFIKKGLNDLQDFSTKEEAASVAKELLHTMQTTFCAKHEFSMIEQFGSFTIMTKPR